MPAQEVLAPDLSPDALKRIGQFYEVEAAGQLDSLDPKVREFLQPRIDTLRQAGILPPPGQWANFGAAQDSEAVAKGGQFTFRPGAPSGEQATTTNATEPLTRQYGGAGRSFGPEQIGQGGWELRPAPPGSDLRGSAGMGQVIGGTLGGGGAALALAPFTEGLSLPVAALITLAATREAARGGGALGEGGQALLERFRGEAPSRAGTLTERMGVAGGQAAQAETLAQALGLGGQALGGAKAFLQARSPTARGAEAFQRAYTSAEEAAIIQNRLRALEAERANTEAARAVGVQNRVAQSQAAVANLAQGISQGAAPATAQQVAPQIRGMADREINTLLGRSQRQAATAEELLSKRVVAKSDTLASGAPTRMTPLTEADISARAAAPRRVLEQTASEAQQAASLLAPIRDAVGDYQTVRMVASRPDVAQHFLSAAKTPEEKMVAEWALQAAGGMRAKPSAIIPDLLARPAPVRPKLVVPDEVAQAAGKIAKKIAERPSGVSRAVSRLGIVATGAMTGHRALGGIAGAGGGFLGGSLVANNVDIVVRYLLDRALNAAPKSALGKAVVSATGTTARAALRPAAQVGVLHANRPAEPD